MNDASPDWGFFGPGTVCWEIVNDPSSIIGAFYAALIFELYPPCAILTDKVGSLYREPFRRARGTIDYTYVVVYGDTQTAYDAAAPVRRMHNAIKADWAMTGTTYRPADPENLLWLHMTSADGFVRANRAYAERPLTDAEVDRFWAEFVPFAELQGAPREMVPASASAAAAYFEEMRPKFALTAAGRRALDQVLYPQTGKRGGRLIARLVRAYAESAVALLEDGDRALIGVNSPRAAAPVVRATVRRALAVTRRVPALPSDALLSTPAGVAAIAHAREVERSWVAAGRPSYTPPRVDLNEARANNKPQRGRRASAGKALPSRHTAVASPK